MKCSDISDPQVTSVELDRLADRRLVLLDHEGSYEGVCLWFECQFPGDSPCLSTSPASPRTHWQQTALVLPQVEEVAAFECVAWEVVLERSSDERRHYNIHFSMLDPDKEPHPIPCDCISPRCALIGHVMEEYEKTVGIIE
ncbi:hypothetical protein PR048_020334 [Dryococelus australis]|uniref:Protein arginine N-methyltransferase domain-containing protein n=1 Tax=Dryococelus australis TaxID=614101 RepID=A0ABQ9H685_9NEOP|nr:hypothetical protein PR048_020334 [Dryococelus australis]